MAGRTTRGMCFPRHLRGGQGKGWRECAASGFIGEADDVIMDIRQGPVQERFADITPGFGTYHPQDVRSDAILDDPTPIAQARPADQANYSKADLGISDGEIVASIREGRPPRQGY